MAEYFAEKQLQSKTGLVSASEALKDKAVVALYFSAHWCPPCRNFTPVLKDFYDEIMKDGNEGSLEIIFVSSDRTKDDMESYFSGEHGDWFAVPFGDEAAADLKKKCNVSGIPKLVVVDSKGKAIHEDARSDVSQSSPSVAYQKWLALK